MSNGSNKNSRTIIIALLILLVGAAALLYLQNNSKNQMEADLTAEKEALQTELAELVDQYDALLLDRDSLNTELRAERDRIILLIDSVDQLEADVESLRRYKNEVYKLRKERQELLARADSLMTANEQLAAEKAQVENELSEEQAKTEALTEDKKQLETKVEAGSKLEAYEIIAGAVKIKGDSEKITDRANKADKIKTCFVLSKNRIAKSGDKVIWVRLLDPEGNLIGKGIDEYAIEVGGEKVVCSEKKSVYYENEATDVCVYVDKPADGFMEGAYTVEIYCEGEMIGSQDVDLRKGWF
jgi:hypothetical protein